MHEGRSGDKNVASLVQPHADKKPAEAAFSEHLSREFRAYCGSFFGLLALGKK